MKTTTTLITAMFMTAGLLGAPLGGTSDSVPCDQVPDEAEATIPISATGADQLDGPLLWLVEDYHVDEDTETVWREFNGLPGLQTTRGDCDTNGDGINDHSYTSDELAAP